MTKKTKNRQMRHGIIAMEIILYLIVFAIVVGGLYLVVYPSVKSNLNTNTDKSEYTSILQGLNQYYSNNYQYPKASGWSWDSANTYILPAIKNKGWNYSCTGNTITITTPSVDPKTQQRLDQAFAKNASSVKLSGSKVAVTLDNKPCP